VRLENTVDDPIALASHNAKPRLLIGRPKRHSLPYPIVVIPEATRAISVAPLRVGFVLLIYQILALCSLHIMVIGYQLELHQILRGSSRPRALYEHPQRLRTLDNESQELKVLLARSRILLITVVDTLVIREADEFFLLASLAFCRSKVSPLS
jgi:hypothetical protein